MGLAGRDVTNIEMMRVVGELGDQTYLHDELDGPDEVPEKLENQVFLLFFHLVQTVLLSARGDFAFGETLAGIRVQHLFRHGTSTTGLDHFFFLFNSTILGLELIDERVHVLIIFVVIRTLLLHRSCGRSCGGSSMLILLVMTSFLGVMSNSAVEVTAGNVGAQMIRGYLVGARMRRVFTTDDVGRLTTDDVVSVGGHVGHCRS